MQCASRNAQILIGILIRILVICSLRIKRPRSTSYYFDGSKRHEKWVIVMLVINYIFRRRIEKKQEAKIPFGSFWKLCFAKTFLQSVTVKFHEKLRSLLQLKFLISSRIIFVIAANKLKSHWRGRRALLWESGRNFCQRDRTTTNGYDVNDEGQS